MQEPNKDRIYVSRLLYLVRIGDLTVNEAMLKYPKDTNDESLLAAYHALIHYAADEDIRQKDELYKQEQDDYLEFISNTLAKGEDLPLNIIESYKAYYDDVPILHKSGVSGFFKSFWKVLNIDKK